jgi:hypothetical protein
MHLANSHARQPASPTQLVEKIHRIQQSAPGKTRPSQQSTKFFLPGLDDSMRAMPNHIARSSLFAPIARGRKKLLKDAVLISRSDALITYSGEQLDEAQSDVWLHAMHKAIQHGPLGEAVTLRRAEFLRAIGRDTGAWQYKWLHRTLKDLSFGMLVIEATIAGRSKLQIGHTRALHLLQGFDYDDQQETYTYRIDPRWQELFGNKEFILIDWEKRLQFGQGQDMAKALQRLVATSADIEQRYSLEWLKDKLQYSSPTRKFRKALISALEELKRLGIVSAARLEVSSRGKEQITWWRAVDKARNVSV